MQNAFHNFFCRDLTGIISRERSQPNTYLKSLGRLLQIIFFGYLHYPAIIQIIAAHYFFAPPAIADYELKQEHHLLIYFLLLPVVKCYHFFILVTLCTSVCFVPLYSLCALTVIFTVPSILAVTTFFDDFHI